MRKPRRFRIELRSANGRLLAAASSVFPEGWHKPQIKARLKEIVRGSVGDPPRVARWVFPADDPFGGPAPIAPRNEPQRSAYMRRKYGRSWEYA